MLKGIHPAISPDLLKVLAEMGHGDEIVLADAHFPGHTVNAPAPERIDRFAFYERAKSACAVVMTGETAKYGNIILKKGVTNDGNARNGFSEH